MASAMAVWRLKVLAAIRRITLLTTLVLTLEVYDYSCFMGHQGLYLLVEPL
ncbi:putative ribonuclease h protein [Sesbania bispinosa]|nr:putative ribonuclease h protein [Sesbania bispinosa]